MADRRCHRNLEWEYRFDRLGAAKLAQVYRALVSEGLEPRDVIGLLNGGVRREIRRDLRARIIGAPKRTANDR